MDVVLKFCFTLLVFMTFSVLKCQAYYCYYNSYYYSSYWYYCPSYYYYESYYTLTGGAIAGIVVGCLFAVGFGIFLIALCCGALGAACNRQQRVSTVAAVPSTNVMTTHYYNQPQAYGYGPQPMAPPPYGYTNSVSNAPPMHNPPHNRSDNQSFPPLPPQNAPQGHSSNPFAISSDVDTKYN